MSLSYAAGDYGQPVVLTIKDLDTGLVADVSGYTSSLSVILKNPDGSRSSHTATFVDDGSDGQITFTPEDGDIDDEGTWQIRAVLTSGQAKLTTQWADMLVYSDK